jgi:transposase-like protein
MHQIHPNARTTPAVRAEIARSSEPSGRLAQRYGVSAETIRKWRKRGIATVSIIPPGRTNCLGRRLPRNARWSAWCVRVPTSLSTI